MTYQNENEARNTRIETFTVHTLVSLAAEYELITSRQDFYNMTEKMQSAIITKMLPYARELF